MGESLEKVRTLWKWTKSKQPKNAIFYKNKSSKTLAHNNIAFAFVIGLRREAHCYVKGPVYNFAGL